MKRRTFLVGAGLIGAGAGLYGLKNHIGSTAPSPQLPAPGTAQLGGGLNYAFADRSIIDYQIYEREGYWLRGPKPDTLVAGKYIAFAGAAQTFGRFAEQPFPSLVGRAMKANVLNLGLTAAGPGAFYELPKLLGWINESKFLVLQVMSGRSTGNSLMTNQGGGRTVVYKGETMVAEKAWDSALADPELSTDRFWTVVDETRQDWLARYARLLDQIKVPIVLLYIGADAPRCGDDRNKRPVAAWELLGSYPQLVTRTMVDTVARRCTRYVESVTDLGLPQTLARRVDMSGGGSKEDMMADINRYYPSPEMHLAAARKLFPVCRELWTA